MLDEENAKMLLNKVALVREVDNINKFPSQRIYLDEKGNEQKMLQPQKTTLYIGYYNGDTNVGKDGET